MTTVLDDAVELEDVTTRHFVRDDADVVILRALQCASGHVDVRMALVVSAADPLQAMRAARVGPYAGGVNQPDNGEPDAGL